MGFGGVMFAVAGAQAVSQISQGYAQQAENKFNARMYEEKAKLIDVQSDIEQGQYERLKGQYYSKSTANIAKSGIDMQGSSLAVIIGAQKNISIDQAIAKFNSTQEKNYTVAQANAQKRAGKQAVYSGYSQGLSTMLQGTSNYAQYKYNPSSSFDYNTKQPATQLSGSVPRRQPAGYLGGF